MRLAAFMPSASLQRHVHTGCTMQNWSSGMAGVWGLDVGWSLIEVCVYYRLEVPDRLSVTAQQQANLRDSLRHFVWRIFGSHVSPIALTAPAVHAFGSGSTELLMISKHLL